MKTTCALAALTAFASLASTEVRAQDPSAATIRNKNLASNANGEGAIEKYAVSGRKSVLGQYYSVNLNCTPADWTEVTLIQESAHGKSKLIDKLATIQFPTTNARSSCNGKSIKAKALEYTPDKDYKGADEIVVELINDGGQLIKYNYKITVK